VVIDVVFTAIPVIVSILKVPIRVPPGRQSSSESGSPSLVAKRVDAEN
jgi:hypothetical protein